MTGPSTKAADLIGPKSAFFDTQGHWAQACIDYLAAQDMIAGYPDGSFQPERPVTRAEFAALVVKAFPKDDIREATTFQDVASSHWAVDAIATAYKRGWLSGYPRNRFKPDQPIPRVQAIVALMAGLGHQVSGVSAQALSLALQDAQQIPDYAKPSLTTALVLRMIVNHPKVRQFNPNRSATRAEIAAFFCQAMTQSADRESLLPDNLIAGTSISTQEIRGVWLTNVDSQVLFSTEALTRAMDRLSQFNFNTVYPTVWNWGYTLYPSNVAQRVIGAKQGLYPDTENQGRNEAQEAAQGNRDMLLELVNLAKERGLRVIPWLEFGFMAPANSALAQRHPDWLTHRQDGSTIDTQDNGKHDRVWLNPFHPEVQQFMLDLVAELVANYDLDGVQLDDHFGLPVDYGYDAMTAQLYQQSHNGQRPPSNYQDREWVRWRANQITQFVARLFTTIKAQNPKTILSVSPSPASFAYARFLQDWPTWERQGYIEELIAQLYRRTLSSFLNELKKTELQATRSHIPSPIGILTGIKNDPTASTLIEQQVAAARTHGYGGVVFFYYDSVWSVNNESTEDREAMIQRLFIASNEG